jgi:hypothetical protein
MDIVGDLFPGDQSAKLQQHTELRCALTAVISESQISDKQPLQAVSEQVCAYSCCVASSIRSTTQFTISYTLCRTVYAASTSLMDYLVAACLC